MLFSSCLRLGYITRVQERQGERLNLAPADTAVPL
jgi:hypothetical protein